MKNISFAWRMMRLFLSRQVGAIRKKQSTFQRALYNLLRKNNSLCGPLWLTHTRICLSAWERTIKCSELKYPLHNLVLKTFKNRYQTHVADTKSSNKNNHMELTNLPTIHSLHKHTHTHTSLPRTRSTGINTYTIIKAPLATTRRDVASLLAQLKAAIK